MNIIGCDPGLTGAIAYIDNSFVFVDDIPITKQRCEGNAIRVVDSMRIRSIILQRMTMIAARENASGYPRAANLELHIFVERPQIGRGHGQRASATNWYNYGRLTAGLPYWREVPANVWKKDLGLSSDKKQSLEMAREIFPECKDRLKLVKHHNRAEALLIGYWAGMQKW